MSPAYPINNIRDTPSGYRVLIGYGGMGHTRGMFFSYIQNILTGYFGVLVSLSTLERNRDLSFS